MKETSFQNKLFDILAKFNNNTAIEYGSKVLTYADVDSKTNCIANHLKEMGIQPGTFIGILQEDHLNLLLSVMGILKAGCVFIPLDTAFPKTRLEFIIQHTGMNYIISDNGWQSKIWLESGDTGQQGKPTFIHFDRLVSHEGDSRFTSTPDTRYSPEDEIYIYFTSGTSGKPKGIIGKNKSLLHFIEWEIRAFGVEEGFRFSQWITPGFDAYLRDVFVPLCSGGTCCIPEDWELILKPGRMVEWVRQQRIHLIHCVPSLFRSFNTGSLTPGDLTGLKYILLSGEEIHPLELVDWFNTFGERIQLANLYGPTETTMIKSCYLIREADVKRERIPIGKAIPGSQLVIFDKQMKPCGVGMVGEIYIRTPYRTAGYYNDDELNRRFIPNPLNGKDPNDLLFKTGDLGRLLPDRNIELLGRIDRQIKWHGIRLEPEEIEHVLVKHPLVKEAVVLKQTLSTNNDTELLVAYITGTGQNTPGNESLPDHLKDYLSGQLPVHMVPGKIVEIEKMPVKPNGKIDYDKLPILLAAENKACVPPDNEIEKKLLRIWSDALKVENFGVTHLLFELGGNSLNVMTLIANIHKEFGVRLTLGEIFNNPTIQKQAILIRSRAAPEEIPASPVLQPLAKEDYYALSSAQKRMYFMQQLDRESTVYNMPFVVVLEGELQVDRLENTFLQLIRRHESLRTSFERVDGEPVQKVYDFEDVEFKIRCNEEISDSQSWDDLIEDLVVPFDLSKAPLLRVSLVKTGQKQHILMMDMHHIVSDGTSITIFVRDFSDLYQGKQLPELTIGYKNFACWQNREKQKEFMKKQEQYWLTELAAGVPELNLPLDFPRPSLRSFEGDRLDFELEAHQVTALKALASNHGATLYMVLLSLYIVLLFKLSNRQDIVVGMPIAGRRHEELRNIIGMFVNMLILKTFPAPAQSFTQLLKETREKTIKAFDNQDYQFEDLVDKIAVGRDGSRNPIFDVAFVLQNVEVQPVHLPGLTIKPYANKNRTAKFDLCLEGVEVVDRVLLSMEYNTKLFKRETVERYAGYFKEITAAVVQNYDTCLADIVISHDLITSTPNIPDVTFGI